LIYCAQYIICWWIVCRSPLCIVEFTWTDVFSDTAYNKRDKKNYKKKYWISHFKSMMVKRNTISIREQVSKKLEQIFKKKMKNDSLHIYLQHNIKASFHNHWQTDLGKAACGDGALSLLRVFKTWWAWKQLTYVLRFKFLLDYGIDCPKAVLRCDTRILGKKWKIFQMKRRL
jgi:hypothetical protein